MSFENLDLDFLERADIEVVLHLGQMILGIDTEELGPEFIVEADAFIANLEEFLQDDLKQLLGLFNSRLIAFLLMGTFKHFVDMTPEQQATFYNKWVYSRLGLFRTGASTLKALCGWSYYSLEKSWEAINYPGKTIGREDKTPTLLQGKQPWQEGMEL